MKSTKTSILFRPWVGAEYEKGIGGKRLLVLGESHYSDTADPELTQIVMKKLLDYKLGKEEHASWMNTFTVFERSVANRRLSGEESCAFWNSVLFCNFLQEVTTEAPRQALAVNDLQRSADAFFELLEEHRPEYIIAWGGAGCGTSCSRPSAGSGAERLASTACPPPDSDTTRSPTAPASRPSP